MITYEFTISKKNVELNTMLDAQDKNYDIKSRIRDTQNLSTSEDSSINIFVFAGIAIGAYSIA